MPLWTDEYPHDLYATVILYEDKIVRWYVGPDARYPESVSWRGEIPQVFEKLEAGLIHAEHKKWVVHDDKEHTTVFQKHAPRWFKQWKMSEYNRGSKPY